MSTKNNKPIPPNAKRISAFEPETIILGITMAVLSAIICMQIIGKVGVTPNTSLIGAIIAMLLGRIPFGSFKKYRNLERQNYVQTIISGAGFAAANSGLLTVSIFFVLGETSYIPTMLVGALIGVVLSAFLIGKLFDSPLYPASEAWPPGVATTTALEAGDEGGKKGVRLLQGIAIGVLGSIFKLPMAGIGIVFIANIFSMAALGIGLIIRGYCQPLTGFNIGGSNIPTGIMVGAGLMALIQSVLNITKGKVEKEDDEHLTAEQMAAAPKPGARTTVSAESVKKSLVLGFGIYLAGAIVMALMSGIIAQMSAGRFILWLVWCSVSCMLAMLLVGMAAMHSGWFPAFAISTIFMTIGMFMGFPMIALALMTGYTSSCGPVFADMGYDLKTGWMIRGYGKDPEYEKWGRKQQVMTTMLGGAIGILVVALSMNVFFQSDIIPPVSKTFANVISAAANIEVLKDLAIWAIPGVLIQLVFGPKRMVGVLLATGLLINNPIYGIGVLVAVVIRLIFGKDFMDVRDAGLIAGDGLFGFFSSVFRALF